VDGIKDNRGRIESADETDRQLVPSLRHGGVLFPTGFLDDDKHLHGTDIGAEGVSPENFPG
jgi:hypothetical protein